MGIFESSVPNIIPTSKTVLRQKYWQWDPIKFNKDTKTWEFSKEKNENINLDKLSVITYNIWFEDYAFQERLYAVLNLCKGTDIICLQEVRDKALKILLSIDWIQNEYTISDSGGNSVYPYGVLILSKIQVSNFIFYPMQSYMNRSFLVAQFKVNNEVIEVGTVHLESLSNHKLRIEQLKVISKVLTSETSIFMGDFNFCSYRNWVKDSLPLENDSLKDIVPKYVDLWSESSQQTDNKDNKGYTFDSEVNKMLTHYEQMRYDRIMMKSHSWKCQKIELIGNVAIKESLFPSDHFGLLAEISYTK